MLDLACDNAMQTVFEAHGSLAWPSLTPASVGDLAPCGLLLAAILLHFLRHHSLRFIDRLLVVGLGALLATAVGAGVGLSFRLTALGVLSIPLVAGTAMWFEGRAHFERRD